MKIILSIILMLFINQGFVNSLDGKGFICTFGKKNIYESYLFYEKNVFLSIYSLKKGAIR